VRFDCKTAEGFGDLKRLGRILRFTILVWVVFALAAYALGMGRRSAESEKGAEKSLQSEETVLDTEKKESEAQGGDGAEAKVDEVASSDGATTGSLKAEDKATSSMAAGVPGSEDKATTVTAEVDDGKIFLSIKDGKIENIVRFISQTTGKPVLKKKDVNVQVTVMAPEKILPQEALELLYDALRLEGFAVLESDEMIRIVPVADVKQQDVMTITGSMPAELREQKGRLIRRVVPLKTVKASEVKAQIEPLLGSYASITADDHANKLIITDTVRNIERYEQILDELDTIGFDNLEIRIIQLTYAESPVVADILYGFLKGQSGARGGGSARSSRSGPPSSPAPPSGGGDTDTVVVPILRTNSILVAAAKERLDVLVDLVGQLDRPKPKEVEVRVLRIEYADVAEIERAIGRLFDNQSQKPEKDQVRVISTGRDKSLIIASSLENFDLIVELVSQLDTEDAQKRETKKFELKYLDASDTAEELRELYTSIEQQDDYSSFFYYNPRRRDQNQGKEVNFVPITRTNSILAIAPPSEFELIESLIEEIDQPLDKEEVLPRIYRIRNADAQDVEEVLNSIFGNQTERVYVPYWSRNTSEETIVGRLAGKVMFSSDSNTNSIIAISNNKSNYEIVDDLIKQLDYAVPELANTIIYPLQHADAMDLARELNSLFGRPVRPQQQQQRQQGQNGETQQTEESVDWGGWWGGDRPREGERPISNLIEQIRFVPDDRTNSLLITTASHNYEIVRGLIEQLDREEPQVLVKVRIVEVREEDTKKIGLRWTPDSSLFTQTDLDNAVRVMQGLDLLDTFGGAGGDSATAGTGNILGRSYTKTLSAGNTIIGTNVNMDLLMQLLIRNLNSQIRINPTLYMSNNQEGTIFVGDNVPRATGSSVTPQGGTTTAFENEDVGVRMRITPNINQMDGVVMTVFVETSQLTGEQRFGSDILQKRTYETEVAVLSGETMVLGGIRLNNTQKIVRKFPLLGDIPLIGLLFRNYDTIDATNRVYVFLTPVVVSGGAEGARVTEIYRDSLGEAYEDEE